MYIKFKILLFLYIADYLMFKQQLLLYSIPKKTCAIFECTMYKPKFNFL